MLKQPSAGPYMGELWTASTVDQHTGTVHCNYTQQCGRALHEYCCVRGTRHKRVPVAWRHFHKGQKQGNQSPQLEGSGAAPPGAEVERGCMGCWPPSASFSGCWWQRQRSFLGSVLHSLRTLYFNKMFKKWYKKLGRYMVGPEGFYIIKEGLNNWSQLPCLEPSSHGSRWLNLQIPQNVR